LEQENKNGEKEKQAAPPETEARPVSESEPAPEAGKQGASQPETAEAGNSPKKDSAGEALKRELDETKKKLEETETALAKQKDVFLRTAAEYDNFRKRSAREKQSAYSDATADAVKEILGVEDNLERALAQENCSAEDLRKGVEMTQKQMQDTLKKLGVSEMEAEGKQFDPLLHNAVSHVEDKKYGENVVVKVLRKGYVLNGKVVRHAIVQTAN
jgi:molecular chaperone GrpE